MNTFVQRVWGYSQARSSRFHDENNRFMGMGQFLHLPQSLGLKVMTRIFGRHPRLPWWPYPVVSVIEGLVQPDWKVLEFGSGRSTLWMADRCAEVTSIESSPVWAAYVQKKAEACSGTVRVIQRELEDYADTGEFADGIFDFCVIDGLIRYRCFENALRVVRPGGYIYLDNSDSDKDAELYRHEGRRRVVQQLMRKAAEDTGSDLREYRGLIVGEVFAGEGLLLHKAG